MARVEEIAVYERDYDELVAAYPSVLETDGVNLDDREAVVRAVWEIAGTGAFDQTAADFEVAVLDG